MAHWKARSELTISVNWTFFARCYGWGATSDYWLKIDDFVPTGVGWPKISRRRGRPHQPFFFSEKWDKCSFVWYINLDRSFYRFVTIHACDGRTDRILITIPRLHYMQRGKNRFASVGLSVCGHSHGRISWSIFTKIGTDVRTPKRKNEFVRGQYRTTLSLFCPQSLHFRPRGPENPCKY